MENEELIEIGKKLQEIEDIATVALVLVSVLITSILLWLALKYMTKEFDKK